MIVNRRRLRVETLARRLGRTPKAVLRWCERNRVFPCRGSWWTTGQAAQVTGLSPQHLSALCRQRKLRSRRVPGGRWWLIAPEEVERLIQRYNPALWQRWRDWQTGAVRDD